MASSVEQAPHRTTRPPFCRSATIVTAFLHRCIGHAAVCARLQQRRPFRRGCATCSVDRRLPGWPRLETFVHPKVLARCLAHHAFYECIDACCVGDRVRAWKVLKRCFEADRIAAIVATTMEERYHLRAGQSGQMMAVSYTH